MLAFYGPDLGLRVARKHLGWYLEAAGITTNRDAILTATIHATVRSLIRDSFTEPREVAA